MRWRPAVAYGAVLSLALVLVLRHQDRLFEGEDWLMAVMGVLTRFGYFEGAFSFAKGLHPNHLFASSYGPAYHLYDAARTLLFARGGLPLSEVGYRYVTSMTAVSVLAISAFMFRCRFGHLQRLAYLILVGLSPIFVTYSRKWCVYSLMMVFEVGAIVMFLSFLKSGRPSRLGASLVSMFLAVTTMATSVNTLLACGAFLLLLLLPRVRSWDQPLEAAEREGVWRLFLGRSRALIVTGFVFAVLMLIHFNYRNFEALRASNGLYQGTLAKSFQKASPGSADPLVSALVIAEEATTSLGPEFVVLLALALANVAVSRRLSHVSLIFAISFIVAIGECLLLVAPSQLPYAGRGLVYLFPLLVVVADNAGQWLARSSRGPLLLALAALLGAAHHRVDPVSDVRSVFAPRIPTGPYKALGYMYRTRGLDDDARTCTALDVRLNGTRQFYMNLLHAKALDQPGTPHGLCVLVLSPPASPRAERAIRQSRLFHRRVVEERGRVVLEVYLNDAMALRWKEPLAIDAAEFSHRFAREFRSLEDVFDRRWAAAPTSFWNKGFY